MATQSDLERYMVKVEERAGRYAELSEKLGEGRYVGAEIFGAIGASQADVAPLLAMLKGDLAILRAIALDGHTSDERKLLAAGALASLGQLAREAMGE